MKRCTEAAKDMDEMMTRSLEHSSNVYRPIWRI